MRGGWGNFWKLKVDVTEQEGRCSSSIGEIEIHNKH